jgi:uncharacterized membrane protein
MSQSNLLKTRILVVLAILAALLSVAKFSHCANTGWATPDQYVHACYSDLPALFEARGLSTNEWPFASDDNSVEYPVVTAMVMYATSFAANSPVSYFNINIFFLILLFIATVLVVRKIRPEFAYLVPVAPAMIASLFINWDLWAIASMMIAIYWFDRKQYLASSVLLGISISTKFLPIFLLIPIVFIFWRDAKMKEAIKYLAISFGIWLAINLPFALTTPTGWWRFYKLNLDRGPDWGSFWLALQQLGINLTNLNYLSVLLLLIALTTIAILLFELKYTPSLASVAFFVIASVMLASKVYSPQYVLWLAPLALIALIDKRDLPAFWIWQITEVIYHVAIWQHLATVTGAKFGLPVTGYALISLLRIAATVFLIAVLVRRALALRSPNKPDSQGKLADFLFEAGKSYP